MKLGFSRRNVGQFISQASHRRGQKRRRLGFDCLEDRRLLSVTTPGTEFEVPGTSAGVALTGSHSVAVDANGNAVVAYLDSTTTSSSGAPTPPYALDFQLFNNSGGTLGAGPSATVMTDSSIWNPGAVGESVAVARAPTYGSTSTQGSNFVVAWTVEGTSYLNGHPYTSYSTYARLYDGTGAPLTGIIQVGGSGDNGWASVAMNDNGFDVAYGAYTVSKNSVSSSPTVTVQRYNAAGALVGKSISVSDTHQTGAIDAISMDPSGNFVVAWTQSTQVGGSRSSTWVTTIDAQRYSASGSAQGSLLQLNTSGAASVAIDASDDYVLAWYDGGGDGGGLITQTVYANGTLGALNHVDSSVATPFGVVEPSIAMQAGGNYAVAWTDSSGTTKSVMADTFLLSGAEQQSPFTVYQTTNGAAQHAAAAVDAAGDLLVTYSGYGNGTSMVNTDGGVFGDFFLDPPAAAVAIASPLSSAAPSGGQSTAATDAAFAAYAYPDDDDTLA